MIPWTLLPRVFALIVIVSANIAWNDKHFIFMFITGKSAHFICGSGIPALVRAAFPVVNNRESMFETNSS